MASTLPILAESGPFTPKLWDYAKHYDDDPKLGDPRLPRGGPPAGSPEAEYEIMRLRAQPEEHATYLRHLNENPQNPSTDADLEPTLQEKQEAAKEVHEAALQTPLAGGPQAPGETTPQGTRGAVNRHLARRRAKNTARRKEPRRKTTEGAPAAQSDSTKTEIRAHKQTTGKPNISWPIPSIQPTKPPDILLPAQAKPYPVAIFKPLPWQIKAWRSIAKVVLCAGSAGGGKSRLAHEKIHAFCLKYPGATALVLRKTRESIHNTVILPIERLVMKDQGCCRLITSKTRFEYANGSILAYGGMYDDSQRERIRGIGQEGGLDFVVMEEGIEFEEDDHNEVLGRLRGKAAPWRQIMVLTNPGHPRHWIKARLIDNGEADVYYSSAHDNKANNPDDYQDTLNAMTGILGKRMREGLWVEAEGVVYNFRNEHHLIDPFPIPEDWPRIIVIDYGYEDPCSIGWLAKDHQDRLYLYREIYMTRRIVYDHALHVFNLTGSENIQNIVAEHDPEANAQVERVTGIKPVLARKDINSGIQAVERRLRLRKDGIPGLMIFKGALVEKDKRLAETYQPRNALDEFTLYARTKDNRGGASPELPIDKYNHAMDMIRYGVKYWEPAATNWQRADFTHQPRGIRKWRLRRA